MIITILGMAVGGTGRGPRACRFCKCTNQRGCMESETDPTWEGPCSWAGPYLCDNPDCLDKDAHGAGN